MSKGFILINNCLIPLNNTCFFIKLNLLFNLLCAPCFAAIGAIKREMNNAKWTWFAILYQCGFAYAIALMINQFGNLFTGNVNIAGLIFAIAVLCVIIYMLFIKKYSEATTFTKKLKK